MAEVVNAGAFAFPLMPPTLAERFSEDRVVLRPFGAEPDDLDLEFDRGDRSGVVTGLLARCVRTERVSGASADLLEALPVGTRLHALVLLCLLSGWEELSVSLRCPMTECRNDVELSVPLAEFARAAEESAGRESAELRWDGGRLRLSLPTGEDLRRWTEARPSDREILAALALDAPAGPFENASDALVAEAEAALAEADPLVDARVRTDCPACGRTLELAVDVEGEAVDLLRRSQRHLVRDVGVLAGAFHWSEREILGLPPRRRRRYLELVEGP